jgi:flagellar basal-body rod modification protein FlgD
VQYSQVEQSMQQTGLLKDVLARLSVNDMTQMTGLIGREVEMGSPETGLIAGGTGAWAWSLPHSAAAIRGEVVDRSGRVIATAALDPTATSGRFSWDGKTADGNAAAPGAYTLRLTATDATGNSLPAIVHGVGTVTEILAGPGGALQLGVGGLTIPATALVRVSA